MDSMHESAAILAQELRRAVTSLLDNACNYTNLRGRVEVSIAAIDGWLTVKVVDDGAGAAAQVGVGRVLRLPIHTSLSQVKQEEGLLGPRAPDVVPGGLAPWQLKRVLEYIRDNLVRSITVPEIAVVARTSPSHFQRAFKRSFGVSVRRYVMHRRIELAQTLMLNTSDPLSMIAASCGMSDQSHLTHCFRRFLGEPPNSWRRARREPANYARER
jgi:AraC family transcriptional regulator